MSEQVATKQATAVPTSRSSWRIRLRKLAGSDQALDAAILAAIRAGRDTLTTILGDRAVMAATAGEWNVYRLIDRRLQALRKSGSIRFEGGRWVTL